MSKSDEIFNKIVTHPDVRSSRSKNIENEEFQAIVQLQKKRQTKWFSEDTKSRDLPVFRNVY